MESLYSYPVGANGGNGGHSNSPQTPLVMTHSRYDFSGGSHRVDDDDEALRDMDYLDEKFSSMSDPSGRSFGSSSYRSDTLSDIKFGLSKVGTVIKIASAILTLFGASDENVDRNDDLESTIGTWMDVGATVLKVGLEKFSDSSPSSSITSSVDKIGLAAAVSPNKASPEIQAYVASLTPDQIKLKQHQVMKHVEQEAINQGLNAAQAEALLAETLEFNGLPQINSNPLGGIGDLFKIGQQSINKIGLPAASSSSSSSLSPSSSSLSTSHTPGLPVPGTLEHTVTLALFNAQQYVNRLFKSKPSQPAIDNKIGVAAGASAEADTGIIGAVSSLPQSVTKAAVQVLKFVNPPTSGAASASTNINGVNTGTSQTYSEVVTGVDPAYAALGVLTTGALASVAYSYVASDADVASSAANLALGAVDAIARNDVVQNIANNDIVQKITNNDIMEKAKTAISQSKFFQKASTAIEKIKTKITGKVPDPVDYDANKYYNVDYNYPEADDIYSDGFTDGFSNTWDDFQTNFDYYQEVEYSDRYPYQEAEPVDRTREATLDTIEWYEPTPSSVPEKVPYVKYTEDHNPWLLLNTGQSTDHLYRGFSS